MINFYAPQYIFISSRMVCTTFNVNVNFSILLRNYTEVGMGAREAKRSLMKQKRESKIFHTCAKLHFDAPPWSSSWKHLYELMRWIYFNKLACWSLSSEDYHEMVQKVSNIPKCPVNVPEYKVQSHEIGEISSNLTFPILYVDIQCQIHLLSIQVHLDSIHLWNIFNGNLGRKFELWERAVP